MSSIRPYRDIVRRKSRKIRVGAVEVGGDAPITVQSMTNTLTADAKATIDQVRRLEEAGADIVRVSCPDEDSTKALSAIVKAAKVPIVSDVHFHHKRAIEFGGGGRRVSAHQPRQYRFGPAREGRGAGGQGPRLLHAHRGQCRIARARAVGEIRRAVPRGDGGERAEPRAHFGRQRFLRIQDQREGIGRVPCGGRVSGPRRGLRLSAAPRHHRSGRHDPRHGEIVDRYGHALVGRHRRHHPRLAVGRTRRRSARRFRLAEITRAQPPRREYRLVPVLRAAGISA